MDPPAPVTALASFPGSGNTWARYLIQQVSGYATGAVYNDDILKNGTLSNRYVQIKHHVILQIPFYLLGDFPGEGLVDGRVIAIKTHRTM